MHFRCCKARSKTQVADTHVIGFLRKKDISKAERRKIHVTYEDVRIMKIEVVLFKESCSISFGFISQEVGFNKQYFSFLVNSGEKVFCEVTEVRTVW